jgi:hypothetical protein
MINNNFRILIYYQDDSLQIYEIIKLQVVKILLKKRILYK